MPHAKLVPGFAIHTIVVQYYKSHRTVSANISFTILFISENNKYKSNEILSTSYMIAEKRSGLTSIKIPGALKNSPVVENNHNLN